MTGTTDPVSPDSGGAGPVVLAGGEVGGEVTSEELSGAASEADVSAKLAAAT